MFKFGNKRVGLASAIIFSAMNTVMRPTNSQDEQACYNAMIAIAKHEMDKAGLAALFRSLFAADSQG